ncbi:hypothetical protein WICMUC_005296 [Wickerhamomyces mucosus]|uniref:Uncharacterized protein n=1 Tax=Wickerhamomyces mucosus TaxID=1378264 RepID=A0A9P8PA83_9ASCO|nr:hypothetical protein WICMUC_005296 [Wickerhamomyces mucosus]
MSRYKQTPLIDIGIKFLIDDPQVIKSKKSDDKNVYFLKYELINEILLTDYLHARKLQLLFSTLLDHTGKSNIFRDWLVQNDFNPDIMQAFYAVSNKMTLVNLTFQELELSNGKIFELLKDGQFEKLCCYIDYIISLLVQISSDVLIFNEFTWSSQRHLIDLKIGSFIQERIQWKYGCFVIVWFLEFNYILISTNRIVVSKLISNNFSSPKSIIFKIYKLALVESDEAMLESSDYHLIQ